MATKMSKTVVELQDVTGFDQVLSVEFAPEGTRAREVVGRSKARSTLRFPSLRSGRMLDCESPNEHNAYALFDCNPDVLNVREQPCIVRYRLGGTQYRHYPDCLVQARTAKTLLEVKTTRDAAHPDTVARTRLLVNELPHHGYAYKVFLAEDICKQPRLRNVRIILRHARAPLTFAEKEFVRRLLQTTTALTWGDLQSGHLAPVNLQVGCRLIFEGILRVNLDEPLEPTTPVARQAVTDLLRSTP
jgi:hypothetical protein